MSRSATAHLGAGRDSVSCPRTAEQDGWMALDMAA